MPYLLPKWKDAETVLVTEGEKDADTMDAMGFAVTCAPFGAPSWQDELTPWFKDKRVYICYDKNEEDNEGNDEMVAGKLLDVAKEVFIINLPAEGKGKGYDLSDFLAENAERKADAIDDLYSKYATCYEDNVDVQFNPTLEEIPIDDEIEVKNPFLRRWVEIHSKITDASQLFILFSGLALASTVVNHFYFMHTMPTHLNLYILLLAPSTLERKSTVIDFVHDYLKEVKKASIPTNLIFPSFPTEEAFYEILNERNRGILIWRELNQVKALFGKSYGSSFPHLLTNAWDGKPFSRQTLKGGFVEIEEPIINILCGGIGEWLVAGLERKDFQGGLWTRFLFVAPERREKPYHEPGDFSCDLEMVKWISELASREPQKMDMETVKPMLKSWMEEVTKEIYSQENSIVEVFLGKLDVQVRKIASVCQLLTDGSNKVMAPAVDDAINICEQLRRKLPNLLMKDLLVEEWDRERERIIRVLKRMGKPTTREIYQYAHISADRGLHHLNNLGSEGLVGYEDTKKGARGQPGKRYFLVKS